MSTKRALLALLALYFLLPPAAQATLKPAVALATGPSEPEVNGERLEPKSLAASSEQPSLASVLDEEGRLVDGVEGSFSAMGYQIAYDASGAPRFTAAAPTEDWQPGFEDRRVNGVVFAVVVSGNDVYVGGEFFDAGGQPDADGIARWDGESWHALGTGLSGRTFSSVHAIAVSGDNIYVGGEFGDAGGNENADGIARWDGESWHALGSGLNAPAWTIAFNDDDVYAGGQFTEAGGNANADYIARWDGRSWHTLGSTLNGVVLAIATSGNDVYAGGQFTEAGGNANAAYIARWDGRSWHALGSGVNRQVRAIAMSGADVYVGGQFTEAGGNANADYIARWDGRSWHTLGSTLNGVVSAIAINGDDVYVGGSFADAGGNENADKIARWDGRSWHALGSGVNDSVLAIALQPATNSLFAGGRFTQTDSLSTRYFGQYVSANITPTPVKEASERPLAYQLGAFYPNPFRSSTSFTLRFEESQELSVVVYDVAGRQVAIVHQGLLSGQQIHTFTVSSTGLPSGQYIVRIEGERFATDQVMTLVQ